MSHLLLRFDLELTAVIDDQVSSPRNDAGVCEMAPMGFSTDQAAVKGITPLIEGQSLNDRLEAWTPMFL